MKNVISIARFELHRLFCSPLPWIIMAVVQFILAIFFYVMLSQYLDQTSLLAGHGITGAVVASLFHTTGTVLLLISPLLTMRLVSDEYRSGTIRFLLSSPITVTELVLGKFAGSVMFILCLIIMISLMPLSLSLGTDLDSGQFTSGLLGVILLTTAFMSIGLFISTLTRQPALAAVMTFAVLSLLWIVHLAGNTGNETAAAIFTYLSLLRHHDQLIAGIFNTADIFYYLLLIILFLVLSVWRLDAMRTHHW